MTSYKKTMSGMKTRLGIALTISKELRTNADIRLPFFSDTRQASLYTQSKAIGRK